MNFSPSDNDYFDTVNKTITVQGNTVNYNNAYYDNGIYYVFSDNGTTTYYTDNSGQIIGDVTYNSGNYYVTIYNQTPPEPTPTPGGDICKHEYKVTASKEPTCTEKGSITYTCSICGDSYTETVKALGHDWKKVETVSPQPTSSPIPSSSPDASSVPPADSSASTVTEAPAEPAYTLYRCARCGEEYKDYDGSGPPAPPAEEEEGGIWGWIKKLVKSIVNGVLGVLEEVVGGIIDFLVKLVDDFFEGVKSVVHNLIESLKQIADFGGEFKNFLGSVFSFLPPEIVVLFSFILSLAIVLAIIKFIRG